MADFFDICWLGGQGTRAERFVANSSASLFCWLFVSVFFCFFVLMEGQDKLEKQPHKHQKHDKTTQVPVDGEVKKQLGSGKKEKIASK